MADDSVLLAKREHFERIFVLEMQNELKFLGDVMFGRADKRTEFSDSLVKAIGVAVCVGASALTAGVGGAVLSGAIGVASKLPAGGVSAVKQRRLDSLAVDFYLEKPEIVYIESVKAARAVYVRYAYFINVHLCSESVPDFAHVAVVRALDHLARHRLPFTAENVLQGVFEGRSGRFASGVSNTALKVVGMDDATAEGVFGRSGVAVAGRRGLQFYAQTKEDRRKKMRTDAKAPDEAEVERRLQERAVKDADGGGKFMSALRRAYGGAKDVAKAIVKRIGDEYAQCVVSSGYTHFKRKGNWESGFKYGFALFDDLELRSYGYRAYWPVDTHVLDACDQFEHPLVHLHGDEARACVASCGKEQPLAAYIMRRMRRQHKPLHLSVVGNFDGLNLEGIDASGIDFSSSTFVGATLDDAKFEECRLFDVDLSKVHAHRSSWRCSFVAQCVAVESDWTSASFVQAHCELTDFTRASLGDINNTDASFAEAITVDARTTHDLPRRMQHVEDLVGELSALRDMLLKHQASSNVVLIVSYLPRPNHDFCGREKEFAELTRVLIDEERAVSVSCVVVVIAAAGGSGKSQLAKEFAHRHALKSFRHVVWWLAFDSDASFATSVRELAIACGMSVDGMKHDDIVQRVRVHLEAPERHGWLLVCDNCEQPDRVFDVLPRCGGSLLFTSRRTDWTNVNHVVHLGIFDRTTSLALFSLVLRVDFETESDEQEAANSLCEDFGDMPLAIAQAAYFCQAKGMPLHKYMDSFKEVSVALFAKSAVSSGTGGDLGTNRTILVTTATSMASLREENARAANMVEQLSFCAPEMIPQRVIVAAVSDIADEWDRDVAAGGVVEDIVRFGLAQGGAKDGIKLHRLTVAAVRHGLPAACDTFTKSANLLASVFDFEENDLASWRRCRPLLSHVAASVDVAVAMIDTWPIDDWLESAGVVASRLCMMQKYVLSKFDDAVESASASLRLLREGVRTRKSYLSEVAALGVLEKVHSSCGNTEKAREYEKEGKRVLQHLMNEMMKSFSCSASVSTSPSTYETNDSAFSWDTDVIVASNADNASLMALDKMSLVMKDSLLQIKNGTQSPSVLIAQSLQMFGSIHRVRHDYVKAMDHYEESMVAFREVCGTDTHPLIANLFIDIGTMHCANSDYTKAMDAHKQSLAIYRKVYGTDDHVDVAKSLSKVAIISGKIGDHVNALAGFEQSLAIFRKVHGTDEHPDVRKALDNIDDARSKLPTDFDEVYDTTTPTEHVISPRTNQASATSPRRHKKRLSIKHRVESPHQQSSPTWSPPHDSKSPRHTSSRNRVESPRNSAPPEHVESARHTSPRNRVASPRKSATGEHVQSAHTSPRNRVPNKQACCILL